MLKNGCEAGCKMLSDLEIKHHKYCQYYSGSTSEMIDFLESEIEEMRLQSVVKWVSVKERLPKEEWGDFLVCLNNNAIFKANFFRSRDYFWLIVGLGYVKDDNPVKYWSELPKPPINEIEE